MDQKQRDASVMWRNMQDKLADRKSPYEGRFGTPLDGPIDTTWGMVLVVKPNLNERQKKSSSSVSDKGAFRNAHRRYALNSGARKLDHRGLARH